MGTNGGNRTQREHEDSPMNFNLPLNGFEIVAILTIVSLFSVIG